MRAFALLFVFVLSACGFQLRGSYSLPWETLAISGLPENSELYFQIKRSIESGSLTKVVTDAKQAKASLVVLRNDQHKSILSLSAKGLVREFQLTRSFLYRVQDAQGKEIQPASQIVLQREMTFDDERVFAKEAEEAIIWREMQTDLVQQLLRRLAAGSRASQG
ncbi:MAG: LPS assembly lipoprotein LptE [Rhodocyclaceae bacterium]|jgi:LPS-assembly lipoprotein|uniref:LPS-assembly lipoprotein LptE n=1 Tax=Sulfuricystis thermophila TaxID=2496847 RepID=UPI00103637A1|nr:LPS assembly lipoprotein LptE [Sulfuricystis thermophila]MDI6748937.1 LPS assembly lipoprotein LptE [Rhodocyclaceae bacterium]